MHPLRQEGDDYEVIPNSKFYVSRTANKDNSSAYFINGKKATFKEVGSLLRSHGIDLDHNRFLILQVMDEFKKKVISYSTFTFIIIPPLTISFGQIFPAVHSLPIYLSTQSSVSNIP